MTVASIITQVNDKNTTITNEKKSKQHLPSLLSLCLRGTRMDVDRDTLLTLPESILVVMFRQGFVLDGHEAEQDKKLFCNVDFNVECLKYILEYFQKAKENFKTNYSNEFAEDAYLAHAVASGIPLNPLLTKQGIIVLREELEFFVVTTTTTSSTKEQANIMLSTLKQKGCELLVKKDLVFEALLKNIDKENNIAEHHLVDMLCTAGFSRKDHWNHRSTEPNKTCISSLSMVSLRHNNRLHIGQKLMMFWRKPARKCWWTNTVAVIDDETVKLWCRRTWTLELVLL